LTPRDEILCGAPDRGRLSVVLYVLHFLTIAPRYKVHQKYKVS